MKLHCKYRFFCLFLGRRQVCALITVWGLLKCVWRWKDCVRVEPWVNIANIYMSPAIQRFLLDTKMVIQTNGGVCMLHMYTVGVCAQLKWEYIHAPPLARAEDALQIKTWVRELEKPSGSERAVSSSPHVKSCCLFCHTWGMLCMLLFSSQAICVSALKDVKTVTLKRLHWWSVQRKVVTLSWQQYAGLVKVELERDWPEIAVTHTHTHKL